MIHELMSRGRVIFDFDGPICSVFAGEPAPAVADRLRQIARAGGADTGVIVAENDPLEVLRWAGDHGKPILTAVEDALVNAETTAVVSAEPTPGAHNLIHAVHRNGARTGIASNNSVGAITAYLAAHRLTPYIDAIAGRQPYAPCKMKPDPSSLRRCLISLAADPRDCVYIGDSITDIQAAQSLGVPIIAFANKPGKAERFTSAGADAIVNELAELIEAVREGSC